MTQNFSLERPELNKKYGIFKLMSITCLALYIVSLYVIAYSNYTFICDVFFLGALGFSVLNFIMTRESFKLDYCFFTLLLFVMYAAVTTFWAECDTGVFGMILTLIQLFGFYMIIRMNISDERDLRVVLWAIYIGAVIMCIYTVMYYGIGEIISRISVGHRIGQEISQVNAMGINCTILNIMTLYYIMFEKKYWCCLVLPLSVFVMIGCGSRKAFLLMALALLLLFMFKSKKGVLLRFMAVGCVLLIALYLVLQFADRESNYFLYRIAQVFEVFQDNQAGLTDVSIADRSSMITYGLELWSDNPVFGYGPEQYEYFYSILRGMRRPPHCTYIQVLVGYGIIGFTLFYGLYVFVFTKLIPMIKRQRKYSILIFTFTTVFLANDFGANMLNNKYLYLFFGIYSAYIAIKLDVEKGENNNEVPDFSSEVSHEPGSYRKGSYRGRT